MIAVAKPAMILQSERFQYLRQEHKKALQSIELQGLKVVHSKGFEPLTS